MSIMAMRRFKKCNRYNIFVKVFHDKWKNTFLSISTKNYSLVVGAITEVQLTPPILSYVIVQIDNMSLIVLVKSRSFSNY